MKRSAWIAALLSPALLGAAGARAEEVPPSPDPPAPAPAVAPADPRPEAGAQPAPAPTATPTELQALRAELERLRREAEEQRRAQEERIRALETKLQDLQKPTPPAGTPATPAPNPVTTRPGFRARLYGFARADVDIDSRKMFSHPHLPFWVLSPQDPRAENPRDGSFSIHPRLTRLGVDTEANPIRRLGDAKLGGKVEVDFFNFAPGLATATSNSRQFVRIRHAYGRLDWDHTSLLFGQYWDVISPLWPAANHDVLMWNAGNLGDRRPQLRGTWEPRLGKGKLTFAAAALAGDAVGGSNRDSDLALDSEESGRPLFQTRLGVTQPSWVKGQTWEGGIWYHNGEYRFNRANAVNNVRQFTSNGYGLDLRVPITRKLMFQGEYWFGKGLADVRGGVGQDISAVTGETIHSRGGWGELLYQFNDLYTLGGGFTIDNPNDDEVTPFDGTNFAATGRTHNRTYYVVNRFNFGSGFVLGVDWMLFNTDYRGLTSGSSNRWNIWLQHNF